MMARLESLMPEFGEKLGRILSGNENVLFKMEELSSQIQNVQASLKELSVRLNAISTRLDAVENDLDGIRGLGTRKDVPPAQGASISTPSDQTGMTSASADPGTSSTENTAVRPPAPFTPREFYFSTPSSKGFEMGNDLDSPARALYLIRTISEDTAEYSPLADKLFRFRVSPESLLLSVCDVVQGDVMTCSAMNIDSPGTLLRDGNTWVVDKKCLISCI